MFKKNRAPIIVEVKDGQWNAYGDTKLNSAARNTFLFQLLEAQGGVSDTVPEGLYHFDLILTNGTKMEMSLTPIGRI